VVSRLREAGHEAIAPDLPCDDLDAGLSEYADTAVFALNGVDPGRRLRCLAGDRDRLGVEPLHLPGGHLPLLARPAEL